MSTVGVVFCGILVVLVAVLITVIAYLWFRIRFAHTKIIVEVLTILFALAVSVGVKAAVLLNTATEQAGSVSAVFDALYKAIGGLTFEGVSPADESAILPELLAAYYGTSLYAGLVAIFIVSVKASYEFYSKLRLWLPTVKSIYIITDISEETLLLAKSIKKNDRSSKIVFAGSRLPAFDRHNDLCQQAMANGFLYWSYARKAKRRAKNFDRKENYGKTKRFYSGDKSITARVGGCFSFGARGLCYLNKNNFFKRIVVLAFAAEDHIPLEAENIRIVCDDIRTRIARPDFIRVEYILQTKDGIAYDAYGQMYTELLNEFRNDYVKKKKIVFHTCPSDASQEIKKEVEKKNEEINKEIENKFYSRFVINCWCESEAIGKQAVEKMAENGFDEFLAGNCEPLYMWTLGFGSRGKSITHELYVQSANIDDKGVPRKCLIDVFDSQADKVGGIYKFEHPNFIYVTDNDMEAKFSLIRGWLGPMINRMSYSSNEEKEEMVKACYKQIKAIGLPLAEYGSKRYSWQTDKRDFYNNDSETGIIPRAIFRFNQVSCNGERFFEMIDRETGVDRSRTRSTIKKIKTRLEGTDFTPNDPCSELYDLINTPSAPKVITVATGDDESNLEIANALIQDIINEDYKYADENAKCEKEKQYLLVNITDKSNNVRLRKGEGEWDEDKKILRLNSRFYVMIVGNFNDIYTYESVIEQSKESYYNHLYEEINREIEKLKDNTAYGRLIEQGQEFILTAGLAPSPSGETGEQVVYYLAESSLKDFAGMTDVCAQMENLKRLNRMQRGMFKLTAMTNEMIKKCAAVFDKLKKSAPLDNGGVRLNDGTLENLIELLNSLYANKKNEYMNILTTSASFLSRCLRTYYRGQFYSESQKNYLKKSIWDKRSNQSAVSFRPILNRMYKEKCGNQNNGALYAWLCAVEHDRWVRLHLAYGWVYGEKKLKKARNHTCIKAYGENFDKNTVLYDLENVIWAACIGNNQACVEEGQGKSCR